MTPEQKKALQDYQDAVSSYKQKGPAKYSTTGTLTSEDLGPSAMAGVSSDPLYKQEQLEALKGLETQSREGLTDRDRASLAEAELSANRANRGRIGAIQQNMQARGMSGSGMDLVAQMQSGQDANETEALKALETAGMAADRRSSATRDLGNMATQQQGQDWQQQAEKAKAADAVAQFNNRNRNSVSQMTWQNDQDVANRNSGAAGQFGANVLGAEQGAAKTGYDAATEDENRRLLAAQERARQHAAKAHATGALIGTAVGGVGGAVVGGPMGAAAGASIGSQVGGGVADASGPSPTGYAHGGKIPGHAAYPGDDPRNDTVPTMLSPGETVVPRSKADAIGDLLQAVAHLHKAKK